MPFRLPKPFSRHRINFKFVYSPEYWMVDLKRHVFPVEKYRRLYERLLALGARAEDFLTPEMAAVEDLLLVHTDKYVRKLKAGKLSTSELMTLELPYSPELFDYARLHVGGTVLAAQTALREGMAMNLGGGFHHAFADHGEGFCIFNDVAVAVEKLRREGRLKKAMIVDCDVHQGNGTADIFSGQKAVFTFSIHQMDLYPARKPSSTLDVELWSGDGDDKYLEALEKHFPSLYTEFGPDLVFYLAGADPFERDQLGGLNLTLEGLRKRGSLILEGARRLGIPVVVLLAGGYAYDVEDTVSIHMNTVLSALEAQKKTLFKKLRRVRRSG